MGLFDAIFYVFAIVIVASALVVAFSRNIMYAAFSLLFTFFGVAAVYVLLSADFIDVTQLMIYVGGILILIIFGVMLTSRITDINIKSGITGKFQFGIAGLLTIIMALTLIAMYSNVHWYLKSSDVVVSTIAPIGISLLTKYLLAFEAASVLLLIAIMGAAMIARRKS